MKKVLCSFALVAALIPFVGRSVAAQDVKPTPVSSLDLIMATRPVPGTLTTQPVRSGEPSAPPYCNPCLFYGGDFDPSAPTANGFANTNTLFVNDTAVYVPFAVPGGQTWTITGMFTNNLADGYNNIDPKQATWSISKGVKGGSGGTTIASGTGSATFNATGRSGFGFNEYTDLVTLSSSVTIGPGIYWLTVVPQCTNSQNGSCSSSYYFVTNSQQANTFGPYEPEGRSFWNSSYFGFDYNNLCDEVTDGCRVMSAGVLGTSMSH